MKGTGQWVAPLVCSVLAALWWWRWWRQWWNERRQQSDRGRTQHRGQPLPRPATAASITGRRPTRHHPTPTTTFARRPSMPMATRQASRSPTCRPALSMRPRARSRVAQRRAIAAATGPSASASATVATASRSRCSDRGARRDRREPGGQALADAVVGAADAERRRHQPCPGCAIAYTSARAAQLFRFDPAAGGGHAPRRDPGAGHGDVTWRSLR